MQKFDAREFFINNHIHAGVRMGLRNMIALRKKQRISFKVPMPIRELRTRIEAEGRENFPSVIRYREILADAKSIYAYLNSLIENKEHAKEASRIKEDIRKEILDLSKKIRRNTQ